MVRAPAAMVSIRHSSQIATVLSTVEFPTLISYLLRAVLPDHGPAGGSRAGLRRLETVPGGRAWWRCLVAAPAAGAENAAGQFAAEGGGCLHREVPDHPGGSALVGGGLGRGFAGGAAGWLLRGLGPAGRAAGGPA